MDFTKGLQAAGPPQCDETQLLETGESTLDKRPAGGGSKHAGYLMLSITNLTGSLWKRLEFREPQTSTPLSLQAGQPMLSAQVAMLHIQDPPHWLLCTLPGEGASNTTAGDPQQCREIQADNLLITSSNT